MSNDEDWITFRLDQAREAHPSIPDAVATRMETLLNGKFVEQSLPQSQLAEKARELLIDMVVVSALPKAVADSED